MRPLVRLGVWGFSAIIAIGVAILAGRSEVGAARASAALAALRTSPMDLLNPGASKAEAEVNDLAETVKALTADRDRLAARVASLEQNLTDLTGSIARERSAGGGNPAAGPADQAEAAPGATATGFPPAAAPDAAAPNSSTDEARSADPTIGTIVTTPQPRSGPLSTIQSYVSAASTSQSRSTPASQPAPATRMAEAPADANAAEVPAPRGIAVELAIATNVNALRARWGTLKSQHPALLENLKPLVAVRPSARPGFTEYHLVAGPVPDSAVAGRLCGALTAAHIPCRPAPYDGQSLDLR